MPHIKIGSNIIEIDVQVIFENEGEKRMEI